MNMVERFDGRFLRDGDDLYRVVGREPGKPSVLLEMDGQQTAITLEEFHRQITLGNVTEGQEPIFDQTIFDDEDAFEAAFREAVLKEVERQQQLGRSWAIFYPEMKDKLTADPRFSRRRKEFPKARAIQLWRKNRFLRGSLALIDNRSKSGNRRERYDDIFSDIVLDLLEEDYLKSDRMTLSDLERKAAVKYTRECAELGIIPGPMGRKAVEGVIERYIPHSDVVKRRLGAKMARKVQLQASRFQKVDYAYDRTETDSTVGNIFVVEDGELIRPTITMAIDAATGFIVGLKASLSSPNSIMTAATLYEAMIGQTDEFYERYQIKNRVNVRGRLLVVVGDQGSENSGPAIDRLLGVTGAELQKNTPGHPDRKPFVERAFRTLNDFVAKLPGATQTQDIPAKKRTDLAEEEACLTFDEFVARLQVWRFDVYAMEPRRRVQSPLKRQETPTEAWRRLCDEHFVPEPPSKQQLAQMFYSHGVQRAVHRYGIEIGRVQYSSSGLRELQRNFPEKCVVEVRVNPVDIREIAVVHPVNGQVFYVPCKDPDMPPISVDERDRILKSIKRDPKEFLSARQVLAALVEGTHHRPSKAKSKGRRAKNAVQRDRRDRDIAKSGQKQRSEGLLDSEAARIPVRAPTRRIQFEKREE